MLDIMTQSSHTDTVALTCRGGWACAASMLEVCVELHTQPTNQRKRPNQRDARNQTAHVEVSGSNDSCSMQHGRGPGQTKCISTWCSCMGDMHAGVRTCRTIVPNMSILLIDETAFSNRFDELICQCTVVAQSHFRIMLDITTQSRKNARVHNYV